MNNRLFEDFKDVSAKQWKQKIQFDLKGADYNNTLVWNTYEDIAVKPFYHAEDFKEPLQISKTKATQWKICQAIFVSNAEKANTKAIDAIECGSNSIKFVLPHANISLKNLLKSIDLNKTSLHFELQFVSDDFISKLSSLDSKSIFVHTDIIGNLAKSGNWFNTLNGDFKQFEDILKSTKSFTVNTSLYQNAGATMVQQLAYSMAHANEYLNYLDNSVIAGQTKQSLQLTFNVSIGTNYFFEIAKLRALRLLWKTLASEYQVNTDCHILATPTKRNKTLYDYNTNMLRTTTECMSAILGGANTICNLPYDAIYHKSNAFGERIARNQLLILKHESYFNKVNNPCDGTYYIETLTQQLAEKALKLFKDIETNGGFLKQLKNGTIQRKIKESAQKEQTAFNNGDEILLGTNKYPNPNDKIKDNLELYPFVKTKPRKTLIEPIIEHRLSGTLEQKRLKNEQ
ncbi:methylmalonyl-CoA mutase subunit beta [Aestuariivivens sp. NBU2969]|uniref:methylmalonyl-CoA mutase subunit beta n=1 Tax=Aestuariivivens sp. NBU2969 TaxID=2873267 RepID=UPI001CBDB2E3|nr:methylmalonyl-CoA mutase subunit beta [Aestuariivivens sp. NBU2969]